jgi:hypothetical protein
MGSILLTADLLSLMISFALAIWFRLTVLEDLIALYPPVPRSQREQHPDPLSKLHPGSLFICAPFFYVRVISREWLEPGKRAAAAYD